MSQGLVPNPHRAYPIVNRAVCQYEGIAKPKPRITSDNDGSKKKTITMKNAEDVDKIRVYGNWHWRERADTALTQRDT